MNHPLDNPIWHALTGPHAALAVGHGLARHYPRDRAPFSAIAEASPAAYADLRSDMPAGQEARLFRPAEEAPPPGWSAVSVRPIIQMIAEDAMPAALPAEAGIVTLGPADAAALETLAEATKPGPFARRTPELGRYFGIRRDGRLLAMAGERFRFPGYVEVSAIAVHPDARGQGLGAALTARVARDAQRRGETPFLHVFPDNPAAGLYARLGFRDRARLWVLWHRPTA